MLDSRRYIAQACPLLMPSSFERTLAASVNYLFQSAVRTKLQIHIFAPACYFLASRMALFTTDNNDARSPGRSGDGEIGNGQPALKTILKNFVCMIHVHITLISFIFIHLGYILELEQPRKTAKIPQIFSDFYYE